MRKTLIEHDSPKQPAPPADGWFDLDASATIEISSEDPLFPIDHALSSGSNAGWRAGAKGPQLIRLNFDKPVSIRRIHIHFVERDAERSQEFAIHATGEGGEPREVVRQQFTFSPGGSTEETEDYAVSLAGITSLELRIDPDRAHDPTHSQNFATLQSLRLA